MCLVIHLCVFVCQYRSFQDKRKSPRPQGATVIIRTDRKKSTLGTYLLIHHCRNSVALP
jgi:hypothetical protein